MNGMLKKLVASFIRNNFYYKLDKWKEKIKLKKFEIEKQIGEEEKKRGFLISYLLD